MPSQQFLLGVTEVDISWVHGCCHDIESLSHTLHSWKPAASGCGNVGHWIDKDLDFRFGIVSLHTCQHCSIVGQLDALIWVLLQNLGGAQQLGWAVGHIVGRNSNCSKLAVGCNEGPLHLPNSLQVQAFGHPCESGDESGSSNGANKVFLIIGDGVACSGVPDHFEASVICQFKAEFVGCHCCGIQNCLCVKARHECDRSIQDLVSSGVQFSLAGQEIRIVPWVVHWWLDRLLPAPLA